MSFETNKKDFEVSIIGLQEAIGEFGPMMLPRLLSSLELVVDEYNRHYRASIEENSSALDNFEFEIFDLNDKIEKLKAEIEELDSNTLI